MTLRRPAAHTRGASGWRRSGDESHWESFLSEEEPLPRTSRCSRAPRPQSAIEGGQLDLWLDQVRFPLPDPSFQDRTAPTPVLEGQQPGGVWRPTGFPSSSTASSSCGSLRSSQESIQTVWFPSPECRGGWEKAHITQSPSKEQAQLSYLIPVKIGWLPIQRRVMMVGNTCSQNKLLDGSSDRVKLKQPITPAFQKKDDTHWSKGETDRSHSSHTAPVVKTRRTTDPGSLFNNEGRDKPNSAAKEVHGPVGWRALRTTWMPKSVSHTAGGKIPTDIARGANSEPSKKPYLATTTSAEPVKHSPLHHTASSDPIGHHNLVRGANTTKTHKPRTPLQRTSSFQPLKATVFYGTNNSSEFSHIQSSSTTLIPQNKAGFSSITISSKKVSRSASLPGSRSTKSPSPAVTDHQPMDPNSRQVRVQRKATIVKVTEQRVISSSAPNSSRSRTPPPDNTLDTVVRRRKATIIKVTEHKESYSPSKVTPRNREYRHSYTEGQYQNNSRITKENPLENTEVPAYHINSSQSVATASNTFSPNSKKNEPQHKSRLKLFLSNPPLITTPPSEPPLRAGGQRSKRPQRPLSCYGSLMGHSDQNKESVSQSSNWQQSSGLPQEASINHVDFNSLFISPGKAADTLTPNGVEKESLPPSVDGTRRASPSLTLIKAPETDSNQSQEEVLALNAAAIIANIKLQRQLSRKKKTPSGDSERDSAASPQGNPDEDKYMNSKKGKVRHHKQPHAEFIPLMPDHKRSADAGSLQRALERSRPEFITRSQERVRVLEQKVQERRESSETGKLERRGESAQAAWAAQQHGFYLCEW